MKNLIRIGFLSLLAMFFFTACEIDGDGTGGTGGTNNDAPSLALVDKSGYVSTSATIAPGGTFNVNLLGAKGAADLSSVEFDIDGSRFGDEEIIDRVTINNATLEGDNVTVDASELSTFDWDIAIVAAQVDSTQTYMFKLIDADGLSDQVSVTITTDSNSTGGTGGGDVVAPTITIPMNSTAVAPNGLVSIPIDIVAGNPLLSQMGVFEVVGADAVAIDASRLELDGVAFPDNPFFLEADDKDGFTKNLVIRAQDNESSTIYIIAFFDEADNVYQSEFTLDTRPQGNAVTTLEGVLFNRAGPTGFGGLDMDSGGSTGSSDPEAEIIDNGIDGSQPNASNWLQTISGTNGTVIKYLIPGQNGLAGDFTFASATTDLIIQSAWSSGVDFSLVNSEGNPMSNAVNVGDLFIVDKNSQYYIAVVKEVNVTGNDNMDNYVMDISF